MLDGVARKAGMGAVNTVPLAEARKRAAAWRLKVHDGIDPIDERRATRGRQKVEAAKAVSFRQAAERYIAAHCAGWRNAKHAGRSSTLATFAYPVIGDLPVQAIDTPLVLKVLEPIWNVKNETASRLRGRVESVLDWAKVREYRTGENPARWRGHLDKLLPAPAKVQRVAHHPALAYADLPAFLGELRQKQDLSARALEFTILTAARSGEVLGAKWPEFDLAAKLWTIPAERMKSGREHRVPLSDRAMAILGGLPRKADTDFVFLGTRAGKPLSNMAMLELVRRACGAWGRAFMAFARPSAIGSPSKRATPVRWPRSRSRMRSATRLRPHTGEATW